MIAPFFIAGFDTPSDLCCRIRLYNKGLCPLIPEFIALGFRRSKKEQHQVLLLQTSNNNYGWNKYHAGIFGEVNSTPYPCKSKFQSEVWDNWNLIFQLTFSYYSRIIPSIVPNNANITMIFFLNMSFLFRELSNWIWHLAERFWLFARNFDISLDNKNSTSAVIILYYQNTILKFHL